MYKVVAAFYERFHNNHLYKVNDTYPAAGFVSPKGRADALCVAEVDKLNATGLVYLESVEEELPKRKKRGE